MRRVIGLGGVFFKCQDPGMMTEWYRTHLGIDAGKDGAAFRWSDPEKPGSICSTVWSTFSDNTKYFEPSKKQFMFNYRVEDLRELLDALRKEGVTVVGEVEEYRIWKVRMDHGSRRKQDRVVGACGSEAVTFAASYPEISSDFIVLSFS